MTPAPGEERAGMLRAYHVTLDALGAPPDEWPCNRVKTLVDSLRERLRAVEGERDSARRARQEIVDSRLADGPVVMMSEEQWNDHENGATQLSVAWNEAMIRADRAESELAGVSDSLNTWLRKEHLDQHQTRGYTGSEIRDSLDQLGYAYNRLQAKLAHAEQRVAGLEAGLEHARWFVPAKGSVMIGAETQAHLDGFYAALTPPPPAQEEAQ